MSARGKDNSLLVPGEANYSRLSSLAPMLKHESLGANLAEYR